MAWFLGLDEAGRGPVAGPLVVAAFAHDLGHEDPLPGVFRDSKEMTARARETAYQDHLLRLVQEGHAVVYVQETPVPVIDGIGIEDAWQLAVIEAVGRCVAARPEIGQVVVDGPRLPQRQRLDKLAFYLRSTAHPHAEEGVYSAGLAALERCGQALVDADRLIWYVSAASVAAKVYRDRVMTVVWDARYPEYGFAKHKGYGTKQHAETILEHGLVPDLHRRQFVPKTVRNRAVWRALGRGGESRG